MPLPLPVRRRISLLPALAGCLLAVVLLHAGLQRIARLRVGEAPAPLPAAGGVADPGGAAAWWEGGVGLLAQTTEPQFYGSALAGLGMIAGAWLAHAAARGRRRWRGFDVSYATGLWPWVLLAAALALALSNLAWGWTRAGGAWQPTFVPFASAAPAIVLIYGPGWRTALTGAVLGAGITTPLALLLVDGVADPLGLPAVTGSVAAMALGALAAFALCRALPWMARPAPLPPRHDVQVEANAIAEAHAASAGHPGTGAHAIPEPDAVAEVRSIAEAKAVSADRVVAEAAGVPRGGRRVGRAARGRWWSRGFGMRDALWLPRRALADLTEPQFYGNEWSSLGLVAGVLLAWWWTLPEATAAATLVPDVLAAQLLTACLAAWLYAGQWSEEGWYPTFVPLVSLVPAAVLDAGGGWPAMLAAAVLGAAVGPGLARLIARRLPADFHPFIGSVAAMCLLTAAGVPVLRAML